MSDVNSNLVNLSERFDWAFGHRSKKEDPVLDGVFANTETLQAWRSLQERFGGLPAEWTPKDVLNPATTVMLGDILARKHEIGASPDVLMVLAALWYRSAIEMKLKGLRPECLPLATEVLTPVSKEAARRGKSADLGQRCELAYENVLGVRDRSEDDIPARKEVTKQHVSLMKDLIWTGLGKEGTKPKQDYDLLIAAWVATGDESVMSEGLLQVFSHACDSWREEFTQLTRVEGLPVLLRMLRLGRSSRRSGSSRVSMSPECRRNILFWAWKVLQEGEGQCGKVEYVNLLNLVIEFAA